MNIEGISDSNEKHLVRQQFFYHVLFGAVNLTSLFVCQNDSIHPSCDDSNKRKGWNVIFCLAAQQTRLTTCFERLILFALNIVVVVVYVVVVMHCCQQHLLSLIHLLSTSKENVCFLFQSSKHSCPLLLQKNCGFLYQKQIWCYLNYLEFLRTMTNCTFLANTSNDKKIRLNFYRTINYSIKFDKKTSGENSKKFDDFFCSFFLPLFWKSIEKDHMCCVYYDFKLIFCVATFSMNLDISTFGSKTVTNCRSKYPYL